ncbi:tyrosine-type recombinase/integrase [Oerskovia flava]|uniref:tyrosine-type recombinase/integrase n=1 Tax=Oerskovia flava TaxID=2986422 RepID=UPI00223FCC93|nr:tyrosine-type recombinase/integrase [Oerskovia sp. JB1-3-2]
MEPASLDDLARSFARHLRAEGRSPATLRLYGQSVRFFAEWLAANGHPTTIDQLNRRNVVDWLADLRADREASTVRTRHRGLYRFAGWAVAEGEIAANPLDGVSLPKEQPKPVPVLTDAELTALVKACKGPALRDRRDEAVVRFLLDCGVRVGELCALTRTDLDLDAGMAIVRGKTGTRPVYFGARTTAALDRYERARRTSPHAQLDAYFLSQRGALTPDGVRELVRQRGARAGITALHPHRFRHTFAHDYLMAGGQERDLKRLAGWSSDVMLDRYGSSAADARARSAAQRLKRGDRV